MLSFFYSHLLSFFFSLSLSLDSCDLSFVSPLGLSMRVLFDFTSLFLPLLRSTLSFLSRVIDSQCFAFLTSLSRRFAKGPNCTMRIGRFKSRWNEWTTTPLRTWAARGTWSNISPRVFLKKSWNDSRYSINQLCIHLLIRSKKEGRN